MRSPIKTVLFTILSAAALASAIWDPKDEATRYDPPAYNLALRNNTAYETLCTNKTSPELPGPAVFDSTKCRPFIPGHHSIRPLPQSEVQSCGRSGCIENAGSMKATSNMIGITLAAGIAMVLVPECNILI